MAKPSRKTSGAAVTIKNPAEIEKMRDAGRVVAMIHARIEEAIAPGLTTMDLDVIARDTLREHGAVSSFLGYHGFPGHICTSVNEQIVHGIPGNRVLLSGDIISVDAGAILAGFHGDSAWTYAVGEVSADVRQLLRDTEHALDLAVAAAVSNARLGAIGAAVERFAVPAGYGVLREYGGHGIGRSMHEAPHVPNHGDPMTGLVLRTGLTLAIEPMLTMGTETTVELNDGWTVLTADGSLSAHFEHTVAVTPEGGDILTRRLAFVVQ